MATVRRCRWWGLHLGGSRVAAALTWDSTTLSWHFNGIKYRVCFWLLGAWYYMYWEFILVPEYHSAPAIANLQTKMVSMARMGSVSLLTPTLTRMGGARLHVILFVMLGSLLPTGECSTTVSYTSSNFSYQPANPERGFYAQFTARASDFEPLMLDYQDLVSLRDESQITLILRLYYLDTFQASNLSAAFLSGVAQDLELLRDVGMKGILRFAYEDNDGVIAAPYNDAPLATILAHIAQLQPVFAGAADTILAVQAGFIGLWGEWYYTDFFGGPLDPMYADRLALVEALVDAVPDPISVQIRTPFYKINMLESETPLSAANARDGSTSSRLGHHNDCFLASSTDFGTYINKTLEYPYLEDDAKFTLMGGETCAENSPRSDCETAMAELELFAWTYLNSEYKQEVLDAWELQGCMEEVRARLGYRLTLTDSTFVSQVAAGSLLPFTITLVNEGYAAPANPRGVELVLRSLSTGMLCAAADEASDPRFWLAGDTHTISGAAKLPEDVPAGTYEVLLHLPDPSATLRADPRFKIKVANQGLNEDSTGLIRLMQTVVVTGTTSGVVSSTSFTCDVDDVLPTVAGGCEFFVASAGFETEAAWQEYAAVTMTYTAEEQHSGVQSLQVLAGPGGARQSVSLEGAAPAGSTLKLSGWSKAQGVAAAGSPSDYCLYADLTYEDDTYEWGMHVGFSRGTHDWEYKEVSLLLTKGVKLASLYLLYRDDDGSAGVVFFDDVQVSVDGSPAPACATGVVYQGDPFQTASADSTLCPAGASCDGFAATPCPADTFAVGGATACAACAGCNGRGECSPFSGFCTCDAGWSGPFCETEEAGEDESGGDGDGDDGGDDGDDGAEGSCAELSCHVLAYCVNATCECQPGTRDLSASGDGMACAATGSAVRFVLAGQIDSDARRRSVPSGFTNADVLGVYCQADAAGWYLQHVDTDLDTTGAYTAVFCIYADSDVASAAVSLYRVGTIAGRTVTSGPEVYAWTLPTVSNPLYIPPTGMEVDSVYFDVTCADSGCWVIKGVLTTGQNLWKNNAFNTFFLPHAVGSDGLSYDYDYTLGGNGAANDVAVEWTFSAANHPCTSAAFDASSGNVQEVTSCCITNPGVGQTGGSAGSKGGFLANYRPTAAFATWSSGALAECAGAAGEVIERPGYESPDTSWTVPFPTDAATLLMGQFSGMTASPGVVLLNVTDPFFGQYAFTIELDEVELRNHAGKLVGTVGVEHTVDTFLGLSNFRTTGEVALDTFSTQVAIHLEKTSFFTASTEGTNAYTFLEYVNLRLIAVYVQDDDFSGASESAARTVRTNSSNQANYVQVTFTLGSQYTVDPAGSPLIPLDSVRAGHGTFFDGADFEHACSNWDEGTFASQTMFNKTLTTQLCAPNAAMCVSPATIPDSFVSFNIPLGVDYFEDDAGGASSALSNNIFVDMVISAVEQTSGSPNMGDDPQQMKTTLTASIPIVEGGVNIFCDGFTAKTDLKDVANVDIVVGSASTAEELTRLRIMEDIASTQLDSEAVTRIDSDSIEAGLMTLVLKGNSSYFLDNTGRDEVTLELEDVMTIHIMEDDGAGRDDGTGKDGFVAGLLAMAPDDNTGSNGLDVDGYYLNGAFFFTIDRSSQRAHLEPSPALLEECPFNPPRPAPGGSPLETCVVRRDVRFRGFPARTGAMSTAMELCVGGSAVDTAAACPTADQMSSNEAKFFTTILGDNEYARKLGSNYARVIADTYNLNNRYRRAYFINPGYEWTPTQTGGTPIFSVSQKLYLFALITLDEGLTADTGADRPPVQLPSSRRRMLLQSTPSTVDEALQDGQSSLGGGVLEFQTTPSQMMARAFGVPVDLVATFRVELQLTAAEACLSTTELQGALRATLDDYLSAAASPYHTVQVTAMSVDQAGVQCRRRSVRAPLSALSDATAEVTMLVVFKEGVEAAVSLDKLQSMAGVQSVQPISLSPQVSAAAPDTFVPPPDPEEKPQAAGSSATAAVMAGAVAGGVVAAVVLAGALVLLARRQREHVEVEAAQSINLDDLKQQLANDE